MLRRLSNTTSLVALLSAIALANTATMPAVAQQAGVTAAVNLNAERTPPGLTTRNVTIGDQIVYDELIETDALGQTQVLMLDRTALSIGPNSSLKIDKFVYDPEKKTGDMGLTLRRGLLRFVGGQISKDKEVKVNTPLGVLGVRGGIALFNVIDEDSVEVTFLFGDSLTVYMGGQAVQQIIRPGFRTRLTRNGVATPWQVDSSAVTEDMEQLQGRAGGAGGLVVVPDASIFALLTEGALPFVDQAVLTNAIGQSLGVPPGNDLPTGQETTIAESQQQIVINNPPGGTPYVAPSPKFRIAGYARQVENFEGAPSTIFAFDGVTETIQLVAPGLVQNTASIAFDPNLGFYYGSRAGSNSYPAAVWDHTGSLIQTLQPMNIDARAWNYNPNTGNVEVVTFTTELFSANRNENGNLLGTYDRLVGVFPDSPTNQTMPAYNPTTNEFYAFHSGATVSVLDAATGTLNSTINLDLAAAGVSSLTSFFIGFDPGQNVLIGVSGARAYIFALDGSFIEDASLTVFADSNFDAGYANGQLFVFDPDIIGFQGFDLFASSTDGNGFFTVSNGVGSLQGSNLNFVTGTGEGPMSIHNPFNLSDPFLYDHPTNFVTKLEALGVSTAIAERLAGTKISTSDFFALTYFSLVHETDPVLIDVSSALTVFAGTPYDTFSGPQLQAYSIQADSEQFSRHAFSQAGKFDTAGVSVTDLDFGLDASAFQTPLYLDLARGKVFLASKVAQGDFANYSNYVFQAGVIAGDIGASIPGQIAAGGGEIVLGSVRDQELSRTQAFEVNMFQTFAAGDFAALSGTGSAIEEFDGPIDTDYLHIGSATTPNIVLDNGTMSPTIEASQLLAAAYFEKGAGLGFSGFGLETEGFAQSAVPAIGMSAIVPTPGSLGIDRVSGNVTAAIELHTVLGSTVLDFGTSAFTSAYLNDANFGIATHGFNTGIGGFLVSGKATSPDDACTCAYLHWGYWAYGENSPPANTNASGVFVAGIPTPVIDMPLAGTATFTGVTEAAWRGATVDPMAPPNPTIYASGTFNHTVDFGTGGGSGAMTLNGETFTSTSVHNPGHPNLQFGFTDNLTKAGAGVGIFTGPQAQNMGVTYNLMGANGFGAAGAIRAERGAITPAVIPAVILDETPGL